MKKNLLLCLSIALPAISLILPPNVCAQTEKVLYSFTGGADGGLPSAGLIFDVSGNLYSTTYSGGAGGGGVVFQLSPVVGGSWSETVLDDVYAPGHSYGGLSIDPAGNLYGTDTQNLGTVFDLSLPSGGNWQRTVLQDFFNQAYGFEPRAGVTLDPVGNIYGTARYGGSGQLCPAGCGVVFRLARHADWKPSVLHSFSGFHDGMLPSANLVLDQAGNVYGASAWGGDRRYCNPSGCGVVFKLARGSNGAKDTVLYDFTGRNDGRLPVGGLTLDAAGNVYGATIQGGDPVCNCGVIFEISQQPDGTYQETVLHTFTGGADGYNPNGNLIFDSAGNLYGTTYAGGDLNVCSPQGCGLVFKLSPSSNGWTETVLYTFEGGNDGSNPAGGLLFGAAGNLYGTAQLGGQYGNGVVFEITP